ncbi:APC family permease [Streptomyces cavernicola]|uniref:APC family permease n=1 Tax=Streptomyces cavernicola TaxID=3043613 RepID=A0ABT6SES9_9ACTN|nr:APC family permease [Streptomyces sp. B-S-A6]MDI3406485.1 APC family permease [Streptomyces sp. B-S-A6]
MRRTKLGPIEGTALYIGGVLGPGVLALPALAAAEAGPASLIAWAALLLLSVPVALSFAALGARFPDGGGVATFVARAFGARAAACVGWWFYAAVPVGTLSGAMIGGQYVAEALGLGRAVALLAAALLLLAAAFAANHVGLHLSGRIQVLLCGVLVLLMVIAVGTAAPALSPGNFSPFMPQGWTSVGTAAVVLFYAFSGWEAASHLSAEFRHPQRHLRTTTVIALSVVGVLYLSLATVTVGVLGDASDRSGVPLMLLIEQGVGPGARAVTAAAAVCLTFGAVNTFIAGAARLGGALGRDGALPDWFAQGSAAGEVPRRSLLVQAVLTGALLAAVAAAGTELDLLMRITSAFLATVTAAGTAAAVALLPRRRPLWWAALLATLFTLLVLLFSSWLLALPASVAAAAALYRRTRLKERLDRPAHASGNLRPAPLPSAHDCDGSVGNRQRRTRRDPGRGRTPGPRPRGGARARPGEDRTGRR